MMKHEIIEHSRRALKYQTLAFAAFSFQPKTRNSNHNHTSILLMLIVEELFSSIRHACVSRDADLPYIDYEAYTGSSHGVGLG